MLERAPEHFPDRVPALLQLSTLALTLSHEDGSAEATLAQHWLKNRSSSESLWLLSRLIEASSVPMSTQVSDKP